MTNIFTRLHVGMCFIYSCRSVEVLLEPESLLVYQQKFERHRLPITTSVTPILADDWIMTHRAAENRLGKMKVGKLLSIKK